MLKNNLNRIDSNQFEVNQLKDHVSHLDEEMNKLRSELEDAPNRGLRKTLISKNIPFQYVWDESKDILSKEIIGALPEFQLGE